MILNESKIFLYTLKYLKTWKKKNIKDPHVHYILYAIVEQYNLQKWTKESQKGTIII